MSCTKFFSCRATFDVFLRSALTWACSSANCRTCSCAACTCAVRCVTLFYYISIAFYKFACRCWSCVVVPCTCANWASSTFIYYYNSDTLVRSLVRCLNMDSAAWRIALNVASLSVVTVLYACCTFCVCSCCFCAAFAFVAVAICFSCGQLCSVCL